MHTEPYLSLFEFPRYNNMLLLEWLRCCAVGPAPLLPPAPIPVVFDGPGPAIVDVMRTLVAPVPVIFNERVLQGGPGTAADGGEEELLSGPSSSVRAAPSTTGPITTTTGAASASVAAVAAKPAVLRPRSAFPLAPLSQDRATTATSSSAKSATPTTTTTATVAKPKVASAAAMSMSGGRTAESTLLATLHQIKSRPIPSPAPSLSSSVSASASYGASKSIAGPSPSVASSISSGPAPATAALMVGGSGGTFRLSVMPRVALPMTPVPQPASAALPAHKTWQPAKVCAPPGPFLRRVMVIH